LIRVAAVVITSTRTLSVPKSMRKRRASRVTMAASSTTPFDVLYLGVDIHDREGVEQRGDHPAPVTAIEWRVGASRYLVVGLS
jgi:hypothetical protein